MASFYVPFNTPITNIQHSNGFTIVSTTRKDEIFIHSSLKSLLKRKDSKIDVHTESQPKLVRHQHKFGNIKYLEIQSVKENEISVFIHGDFDFGFLTFYGE